MKVEVPADSLQKAMLSAARRISKKSKIPGFRPGKAPLNVVSRMFGEDAVLDEALETLAKDIYLEAVEESDVEPYAPASFEDIESRDPLTLKYIIPLPPEIDLGAYSDIRVDFEKPEISVEELESMLESLRESRAIIEPVERPAEKEDLVVIDVHGSVLSADNENDEETEPHILLDEHNITLLVGGMNDFPFPGFSDDLLGLEAEQEKEIEHVFADDHAEENMQGRKAIFKIKCHEVKSRELPEWTDEFAVEIGEYEDLADLKSKINEQLQTRADNQAKNDYAETVIDAVLEGTTINYPPLLFEEEMNDMLREFDQRLRMQNMNLQDYLKLENKTPEQMRADFEPGAKDRVKRSLMLSRVIEDQKLRIEEEEVDERISGLLASYGDLGEKAAEYFKHPTQRQRIAIDALTEKAVERLVIIARGEFVPAEETTEEETESVKETVETAGEVTETDSAEETIETAGEVAETESAEKAEAAGTGITETGPSDEIETNSAESDEPSAEEK